MLPIVIPADYKNCAYKTNLSTSDIYAYLADANMFE